MKSQIDIAREALKLLDDIVADLDMRARMNGQVEDGKAVLDLSNGLLVRLDALKAAAIQSVADEREAFEKQTNDARFFPAEICFARTKSPSGRDEYVNTHLQSRWEGWQDRASLPPQAVEPVAWRNESETPTEKGWYAVMRADESLCIRAWGNEHWWIPLADGWLSGLPAGFKWFGPIAPIEWNTPREIAALRKLTEQAEELGLYDTPNAEWNAAIEAACAELIRRQNENANTADTRAAYANAERAVRALKREG